MPYIPYRKAEVTSCVAPKSIAGNYIHSMEFMVVLPCELHSCEKVALNKVFRFLKEHGVSGDVDVKITEGLYTIQRFMRLPARCAKRGDM